MANFEFDASDLFNHLTDKERRTLQVQEIAVQDSIDDLKRISSEIAPIKDSGLRKSVTTETEITAGGVVGEVHFSVLEKTGDGTFNYAYWTHEMDYNLGPRSAAAPGTDGYHVGNKYLERPLKGESQKYVNNWAKAISEVMDK